MGFTYDTAEKRIIVFYGYTNKSDKEIFNFYDENLKQLGWYGKLGKYKRQGWSGFKLKFDTYNDEEESDEDI